eukprot:TRINITY_DN14647_c0_g1_i1.p1 TRINITY_DN14647_c0_g1~~TRINITY_DN14647_c0_g1_i1.p1  ORF type:complete len:959 (+),score=197.67 TRINITY_DN14647_c0_g1_i1:52-2928(+)
MNSALLFLIDVTGSMSPWINALREALPSFIRSISLTSVFSKIGILSYTDYDQPRNKICNFSGFCTTNDVLKLTTFAASLSAQGGGGTPEAVKTAIFELATSQEYQVEGKLFILHLTDAPPHVLDFLDSEGRKEQTELGIKSDWVTVTQDLLNAKPNLRYTCLSTSTHAFYCYLAKITGGSVHSLGGACSTTNIRKQMMRSINAWFGFEDCIEGQYVINVSYCETEKDLKVPVSMVKTLPEPDQNLTNSLFHSVSLMQKDEHFIERAIEEFKSIISENPMALTISPILGKMWREFCKRRSDPRRDELIELLHKRKKFLSDLDKKEMEEWLKESYDASAEIIAQIKTFMSTHETKGLLRFIPENDDLCAQQVVHLLASGDKKSTSLIRAILSRFYVDNDFHLPVTVVGDSEGIPLPVGTIPLNLFPLFSYCMHTVAPGTRLTQRYSAMLSLHSLQCGSVLSPEAVSYLSKIRGKWINWKRREDGIPEVPENWSNSFLDLILHPESIPFLLPEELDRARFMKKIAHALRFYHGFEITVRIVDSTSADGSFPDHPYPCRSCKKNRPLSLVTNSGDCAFCVLNLPEYPAMEDMSYLSVRCSVCGSFYCRDQSIHISEGSKCHGCRILGSPSPSSKCSVCEFNFVKWVLPEEGLPDGICGGCKVGRKRCLQLREFPELVHKLLDRFHFVELCASVGISVEEDFKPNTSLYESILHMKEMTPQPLPPAPCRLLFRNTKVQNFEEIWNYVFKIISGGEPTFPECSVCFEQGRLSLACGRRGCLQRVCQGCNKSWYSKNSPGTFIYQRALLCQFCCRVPVPRVLSRVDENLVALANSVSHEPLKPDCRYGWCTTCLKPVELDLHVNCGDGIPNLVDFKCQRCIDGENMKDDRSLVTKECPGCTVTVFKISGCNHICCTSCGCHWCWECGKKFPTSDETYSHMWGDHGNIFEGDGYVARDEEEEEEDW